LSLLSILTIGSDPFLYSVPPLEKDRLQGDFLILSRTPSTAARSWSASSNEGPARHLLTYSKR
jgi:hypothetical protein